MYHLTLFKIFFSVFLNVKLVLLFATWFGILLDVCYLGDTISSLEFQSPLCIYGNLIYVMLRPINSIQFNAIVAIQTSSKINL